MGPLVKHKPAPPTLAFQAGEAAVSANVGLANAAGASRATDGPQLAGAWEITESFLAMHRKVFFSFFLGHCKGLFIRVMSFPSGKSKNTSKKTVRAPERRLYLWFTPQPFYMEPIWAMSQMEIELDLGGLYANLPGSLGWFAITKLIFAGWRTVKRICLAIAGQHCVSHILSLIISLPPTIVEVHCRQSLMGAKEDYETNIAELHHFV